MRIGLTLVAVAALAALAACGSSSATPPPRPTPSVPTMVDEPINLTGRAATPCTMLRPDQLAQFHIVAPGTPSAAPLSPAKGTPACAWQPMRSTEPVYAAAVDTHSGGLDALYRHRAALPVFQPFAESGYPGVNTPASKNALTHGQCTIQIEVANGVLLDAAATVRDPQAADYTDPCQDAQSFAAAIIANSQGQQP
ncbi:MAG TPA: DUF3558 family protein [Pseudonocardiaceae bacterium]|nr:DUF3558 family protein [Pseudonocardiaceae bacterium]